MAPRNNRYEYETSPRKVEPNYVPPRKKKSTKEIKKQIETKAKDNINAKRKSKEQQKKVVLYVLVVFGILLAISYRNSLINENFIKVKSLKSNLSLIEKENQQLQVNIEGNLNLNSLEQSAKEKLGMQKLDNSQKIYINLPKKDYVEPATEKVEIQKNLNWFQKILNKVLGK